MRLKLKFCFALAYSRPKNAKLTPVMQATTVQLNTIDVVRCCLGNAEGKPSRCDIHHEN